MSVDMVKHLKHTDSSSGNLETSYLVGDEEFLPLKERPLLLKLFRIGNQLFGAPFMHGSRRVIQISVGFMIFFSMLGKFGTLFTSILFTSSMFSEVWLLEVSIRSMAAIHVEVYSCPAKGPLMLFFTGRSLFVFHLKLEDNEESEEEDEQGILSSYSS